MKHQKKRLYLSPPHMGEYEQQFVAQAFETNWIAPLGPQVDAFEQELSEYVGIKGAVALSSGTAAIHLAVKLLDVGPGDIVFCSTLTFVASANPIIYQGATPVFIDSEAESWNMSPSALQRAMEAYDKYGRLPKAVIIVNLYGQSADMQPLTDICARYGVPIIEDAAESLGATYRGKASGTFGKFGIYSFNGNKIITTSGGGMLVSDDLQALEKARFWATQSKDPAGYYQHHEVGYNYRLSNVLAAIGRGQLRVLEERALSKKVVFERYKTAFSLVDGIGFMPEASFGCSTRWLTAITVDPDRCGATVTDLIEALEEENIEARRVWKPLHLQPLFQHCDYFTLSLGNSVSDELFEKGLCLPSSSSMTDDEQYRVIECIRKYIRTGKLITA